MAVDSSQDGIYFAFGVIWTVATLFVVLGSAGVEPAGRDERLVNSQVDNPISALQVLSNNATAKRFFIYLLLVLVGIRAQDVLLEPFAADALGMSISETTRLEAVWGIGVFITLLGGLGLVRLFGKRANAYAGAGVAITAFGLIIITGALGNVMFFHASVLLLGLGSGLMTVSNLSFMLDMTTPQKVGLYMGVWGVANFLAQSLGTVGGALLRDIAYQLTGNVSLGYMTVFGLAIVGLVVAMMLFRTITVDAFERDEQVELTDVLAIAGD